MVASTLHHLRREFLQEASSAPKLFSDLAKVEQYIAESYQTRAFIELIQNADDAQATAFGLEESEGMLLVGNNGRPFTAADVEALCRSGSSTKQRGGSTIGYRGIGFKSVVNLAKRICVFSDDYAFWFDKSLTQRALEIAVDVPLIRMPHPLSKEDEPFAAEMRARMKRLGYNTLFVFQHVNSRVSAEDLAAFDRSSLLFLNHIRRVDLIFNKIARSITMEQAKPGGVRISEGSVVDEWQVLPSPHSPVDRIALKVVNGAIVPATSPESVVHSFTPTLEFAGAALKINGDYTTDPSRKHVDFDELSQRSLNTAAQIVVDAVTSIFHGDATLKGFFSPFAASQTGGETGRFRTAFLKAVRDRFQNLTLGTQGAKQFPFTAIRLRPEWLNYEDYEVICQAGVGAIPKALIVTYPEINSFFQLFDVQVLTLEEILERVGAVSVSTDGAGQVFAKIINQYRYDLSTERVRRLSRLRLFPVRGAFVTADKVKSVVNLDARFREVLAQNTDVADAAMVFRRLGIETPVEAVPVPGSSSDLSEPTGVLIQAGGELSRNRPQSVFRSKPAIKKWRSAEQNTAEYLRALQKVLSVTDVTQANLGYDLEVMLQSGHKVYVEIKSVTSFTEPFKISNNEYASAHSYGDSYYLAVVVNEEPFQIRLIANPITNLAFEKKCERWSWYCEEYSTSLLDVTQVF